MRILLSSFGLSHQFYAGYEFDYFYRMPPVSEIDIKGNFVPNYSLLLLCDQIVIDLHTYSNLRDRKNDRYYSKFAETIEVLRSEGFVHTENFEEIIEQNRSLLEEMTEKDLSEFRTWFPILLESISLWRNLRNRLLGSIENKRGSFPLLPLRQVFASLLDSHLNYNQHSDSRLIAYDLADAYYNSNIRECLTQIQGYLLSLDTDEKNAYLDKPELILGPLKSYLSYVNSNLVLSNILGCGFHDWSDYFPFYREKFLSVGHRQPPKSKEVSEGEKLFKLFVPNLNNLSLKSLVRTLRDKRINDLRSLVSTSVENNLKFDQEFAKKVLWDFGSIEKEISRFKTLVGRLTLPLSIVPGINLVQKSIEETATTVVTRRLRKDYQWFYLISDLREQTTETN